MDYYVRFMYSSWLPAIFANNQENFIEKLCLNVITAFTIIVVALQLRDVLKTVICVNQNGGTLAVVRRGGGTAPSGPPPPVATALS